MDLTPARRRALEILDAHPDLPAGVFAKSMWPNSKGHKTRSRRHSTPAGGAIGAGIQMTAGAFLNRMRRDGLVYAQGDDVLAGTWWNLTTVGRAALEEWRRSVRAKIDAETPAQREAALDAMLDG